MHSADPSSYSQYAPLNVAEDLSLNESSLSAAPADAQVVCFYHQLTTAPSVSATGHTLACSSTGSQPASDRSIQNRKLTPKEPMPTLEEEMSTIKNRLGTVCRKDKDNQHTRIIGLLDDKNGEIKLLNSLSWKEIEKFNQKVTSSQLIRIKPKISASAKYSSHLYLLYNDGQKKIKFGETSDNQLIAIKKNNFQLTLVSAPSDEVEDAGELYDDFLMSICLQKRAGEIAPMIYGAAISATVPGKSYLAMELLGLPLDRLIPLPIEQRLPVAIDMATKLQALHKKHIYHGDLKFSNVLFSNNNYGEVKLIDYELSEDTREPVLITFNPEDVSHYHAPEIYQASVNYHKIQPQLNKQSQITLDDVKPYRLLSPERADIYSLGMIFAALFSNQPQCVQWHPYYKDSPPQTLNEVNEQKINNGCITNHIQRSLVQRMITDNPDLRPGLAQIVENLWFQI